MRILLFTFLVCNLISAQLVRGSLVDKATNKIIPFATVSNTSNETYTFSDENGDFEIFINLNDSLTFSHINFQEELIQVKRVSDIESVKMMPLTHILGEIVIGNNYSKSVIKIGFKKGRHSVGLGLNTTYALRIKSKVKGQIQQIDLPVKIDKKLEFENAGVLNVQLFKNVGTTDLNLIRFSEVHSATVVDGKYSFNLKEENVYIDGEDFFVVFNRVIPNETFETNSFFSVNPSIYFENKGVEDDLYKKFDGGTGWIENQYFNKNYSGRDDTPSPLFSFKFTIREVAE